MQEPTVGKSPTVATIWYGLGGEALSETDLSGNNPVDYVYFGGRRLARVAGGVADYYVEDFLNSSRVNVQAGQNAACYEADFEPYGREHVITNTCPQHYKFASMEQDAETALNGGGNDHTLARQYPPNLARWLSPDPAGTTAVTLTDPQTWNPYAYVRNIPATLNDPSGLDPMGNGRIDAAMGPTPSQTADILLGAGKGVVNAVTSTLNVLGEALFGIQDRLFGGTGRGIPQLTAKNDYQAAGMVLGAVGLFFVPGGEEEGLTVGELAEAFGFKSAGNAGELVGGELANGARVAVTFSKEGSTLDVGVPVLSEGPAGTVSTIEGGAVNAAKAAGAESVRITAVNPNASMERLLRLRGYTQLIKKGKATGRWVKIIKVSGK